MSFLPLCLLGLRQMQLYMWQISWESDLGFKGKIFKGNSKIVK